MDNKIISLLKDKDFSLVEYSEPLLSDLQEKSNKINGRHDTTQEHANKIIKDIFQLLDDDKGNGYFISYVIEMITRILNNRELDSI
jgi:hypothetical protein